MIFLRVSVEIKGISDEGQTPKLFLSTYACITPSIGLVTDQGFVEQPTEK